MLVVIAIIALLASLLVPAVNKAMGSAKTLENMSKLRSIGQAIRLYSMDHHERLPVRYGYSEQEHGRAMHWQEQIVEYVARDREGSTFDYQQTDLFTSTAVDVSHGNHFGLNKFMFESNPEWNYYLTEVPNPTQIVIVGEINRNSSTLDPEVEPAFDGDSNTYYRISNPGGFGIYLFADLHVEKLRGNQGTSVNPDIWKWW